MVKCMQHRRFDGFTTGGLSCGKFDGGFNHQRFATIGIFKIKWRHYRQFTVLLPSYSSIDGVVTVLLWESIYFYPLGSPSLTRELSDMWVRHQFDSLSRFRKTMMDSRSSNNATPRDLQRELYKVRKNTETLEVLHMLVVATFHLSYLSVTRVFCPIPRILHSWSGPQKLFWYLLI